MTETRLPGLDLIEEERRSLIEDFLGKVSELPPLVRRVDSLKSTAFKEPDQQFVDTHMLLVLTVDDSFNTFVKSVYEQVTEGNIS